MSKTLDIITLLDKGFVPYSSGVPVKFYKKQQCSDPRKAEWFTRPWENDSHHLRLICLGCRRRCVVVDPEGWPSVYVDKMLSRPGAVAFATVERLNVKELLNMKPVLRVDEAAWILNISRQKVHDWVEEGLLDTVPGTPVRVTSVSVQKNLVPLKKSATDVPEPGID